MKKTKTSRPNRTASRSAKPSKEAQRRGDSVKGSMSRADPTGHTKNLDKT